MDTAQPAQLPDMSKYTLSLKFEDVLPSLRNGFAVMRTGWKNASYIFLVQGSTFKVNRAPLNVFYPEGTEINYRPHIDMVGTDGTVGTWAPSMVDLMAEDWLIITGKAE